MKALDLARYIWQAKLAVLSTNGGNDNLFLYPMGWFEYDVRVIAPNGVETQVNPKYAATVEAATKLCAVLATERKMKAVVELGDVAVLQEGWTYNKQVHTLDFDNGFTCLAGLELDFWNHGFPARYAMNLCQFDILEQMFLQGFIPMPPDPSFIMSQDIIAE